VVSRETNDEAVDSALFGAIEQEPELEERVGATRVRVPSRPPQPAAGIPGGSGALRGWPAAAPSNDEKLRVFCTFA